MARRYSGDVELRIHHVPGSRKGPGMGAELYVASVRAPGEHGQATVHHQPRLGTSADDPRTYDAVAKDVILAALRSGPLPLEHDEYGDVVIRRVFQSPCPI